MMIKKMIYIISAALVLFHAAPLLSQEEEPVTGNVAVLFLSDPGIETEALAMKTAAKAYETFNLLGRFLPVEQNRVRAVMENRVASAEEYRSAARELGVDLFVLISVFRQGPVYYARLEVAALSDNYAFLNRNITVKSRIMSNIPLKAAREIAFMHEKLPLNIRILKQMNGLYLIDAGQWHGLVPGRVKTQDGDTANVIKTSRYRSLMRLRGSHRQGDELILAVYPSYKKSVREMEREIDFHTNNKYALKDIELNGDNPEKRFMKGICLINLGASFVAPGYGAYLSAGYMGLKDGKPCIASIVVSAVIILNHYLLTEFMTGFTTNFFPWIQDSDKTDQVQNLQIFLWSTLFTTFTVSFLDQLACQYRQLEHLPPFFLKRDIAAATLSLFVPGGGLFFKGYRAGGWAFYVAEMALAGYGSYYWGMDQRYIYAFSALAVIKLVDIICAYFINTSYPVYLFEQERQSSRTTLSFNVLPTESGDRIYRLGLVRTFM
jgi:hypothetical protein